MCCVVLVDLKHHKVYLPPCDTYGLLVEYISVYLLCISVLAVGRSRRQELMVSQLPRGCHFLRTKVSIDSPTMAIDVH